MIATAVTAAAAGTVASVLLTGASAQAPARSAATAPALKTPWGEPDLQGIWTDETDTPLQRPAKYANQEFFTPDAARRIGQRAVRSCSAATDARSAGPRPTSAGAYNSVFVPMKHTGARTSLIVDPPNGRIPPLTPEAQKSPPPIGNFALPCCKRPRRAREVPACRRQIRSDALAATRGTAAPLQHRTHQSP